MRNILILIFINLILINCQSEKKVDSRVNNVHEDSLIVKNEISKDSILFDLTYKKSLKNFNVSVSKNNIFLDDCLSVDRYYYKNGFRIFNYYLFKFKDTSFVISYNLPRYCEKYNEFKKNDEKSKFSLINIPKQLDLFIHKLNIINKGIDKCQTNIFSQTMSLLITKSENLKLITKDNFNKYFNQQKYIDLGCPLEEIIKTKRTLEISLNDINSIVGYSNNLFIVIKKDKPIFCNLYFIDYAKGWYL